MFDGTLARATGKVSPLGAFMDSVFDRAGEVIVYVGIVVGLEELGILHGPVSCRGSARLGRHGQLHPIEVGGTRLHGRHRDGRHRRHAARDPAGHPQPRPDRRRHPRYCALLHRRWGRWAAFPVGAYVILVALGIIAVGATITVIQRILHVRSQAKSAATTSTR